MSLLAMGGYELYVWSVVAITVVVCIWLAIDPVIRHNKLLKSIKLRQKR